MKKKPCFFPLITYKVAWMGRNSNILLPVCNNAFIYNSSLGFDDFSQFLPRFQFLHGFHAITWILSSAAAGSQALGLSAGSGTAAEPKLSWGTEGETPRHFHLGSFSAETSPQDTPDRSTSLLKINPGGFSPPLAKTLLWIGNRMTKDLLRWCKMLCPSTLWVNYLTSCSFQTSKLAIWTKSLGETFSAKQ